jgi:hypothetical protein
MTPATIKKAATNKILAKGKNQHDHRFATGRRFTFRMPLRSHPDCRATRYGDLAMARQLDRSD